MFFEEEGLPNEYMVREWLAIVDHFFKLYPPRDGSTLCIHGDGQGRGALLIALALIHRGLENSACLELIRK